MPRKERITDAGFYHIINRGVERRNIFIESEDYDKFGGQTLKLHFS